ncbi:MAG: phosphoribosylglycinamide formyltransferase [Anaerolineales bacterium]|nr:phosphoribosylglycinamide formyltransferase [Anaerolineales bacterium]
MSDQTHLVVLASGSGTNLQAILDVCKEGNLPAAVVAVISDQKNAYALERANAAGVPVRCHPWKPYKDNGKSRIQYDADLAQIVFEFQPDYVILAGWMRLLSMAFLAHFPMQVINLHPALPGTFPGTHAIERAYQAYQSGQIKATGVMVHFVPDEGVDDGPLIAKQTVPIYDQDTLETLENRIHHVEHKLLVDAINQIIQIEPEY